MIYHIATESEWEQNKTDNFYSPERFTRDGFIHCSTKDQVGRTANTLFKSHSLILLLCINDEKEKDFIRYENLEGGSELFPHIYRRIPKESIEKIITLTKMANTVFNLPSEIISS